MRTITLIFISLALLFNPTTGTTSNDTIPYYLFTAASTFKLDVGLLFAFCRVESRCRQSALNKNDANRAEKALGIVKHSHGLFQIQMGVARGLGFKGKKKDLMSPTINTYYAAKFIKHLVDRYHDPVVVIAAYNAGEPKVDSWLKLKSKKLYNQDYVHRVLKEYIRFQMENKGVTNETA